MVGGESSGSTPAMAIASLTTAYLLIIPLTNYLWSFIYEFHKLKQHSETISKNFYSLLYKRYSEHEPLAEIKMRVWCNCHFVNY